MGNKSEVREIILILACIAFVIVIIVLHYNLKSLKQEINAEKAELTEENLYLKDDVRLLEAGLAKQKETLASLEEEKEKMRLEYSNELKALKEKSAPPVQKISEGKEEYVDLVKLKKIVEPPPKAEAVPVPVAIEEMEEVLKTAPPRPAVREEKSGKITSVDEKDAFIIIDLGSRDGVKKGGHCKILKDGRKIASAEIISVRYNASSCSIYDIVHEYNIADIVEGDIVLIAGE